MEGLRQIRCRSLYLAPLLKDISALNEMMNDTLAYLSKEMANEMPVKASLLRC